MTARPLIACLLALAGCDAPAEAPAPDPVAELEVVTDDPSDHPIPGLDAEWRRRFVIGDAAFEEVFDPSDGLGPTWARRSCTGCHEGDARGPGMVRRVAGVAELGPTLHPFALGRDRPSEPEEETQNRLGPALFGRGWIEAVDGAAIEAGERAQRAHREISGRVARVPLASRTAAQRPFHDHQSGSPGLIGRFGLKARHATVDDFVADAYLHDMGLTTPARPEELGDERGDDERPGVDLELAQVHVVADYVRLLRIPERQAPDEAGRALFASVGCATCHTPSLPTRADYPIPQLAGKDAAIYSDLLLHDMGEGLADGFREVLATGREWRTAPLIGLRHLRGYLHDGRAETVDEAIRAHGSEGSEAAPTVARYLDLNDDERGALLRFVEAL